MRRLRVLLSLLLVPVVVLAVPNVAQAAELTGYGVWKKAAAESDRLIDLIKGVDYLRIECTMAARYKVTSAAQYAEFREGTCTSYSNSVKEGKPYTLTMNGKTSTGADCSGSASGTFGGAGSWGGVGYRATFAGTVTFDPVMGPQLEPGCFVTDWTLDAPGNSFWDGSVSMAGPLDLGTMPQVSDGAPATGETSACGSVYARAKAPACSATYLTAVYDSTNDGWLWAKDSGASHYNEVWWFLRSQAPASGTSSTAPSSQDPKTTFPGTRQITGGNPSGYPDKTRVPVSLPRPATGQPDEDVVAVKMRIHWNGSNYVRTSKGPYEARAYVWAQGSTGSEPPPWSTEEPTVISPGTETDPTETAPVDERDSCGFKWTDPTTYASAGICAVVSMLTKIWETLKGLPGAIGDLFVPSDGFMEAKGSELKDAWSQTPPLVVLDGVQDLGDSLVIDQPPGACAGPSLDFTTGLTGPVSLSPLSTCREQIGTLASIIKTALTVVVYVGAFLAGVRIIGSAFGVDLSMSKGGETI